MKTMKKISLTKEWCMNAAAREAHSEVGAGLSAFATWPDIPTSNIQPEQDKSRIVFGRFVQLMRRKRSLTVEELAIKADIDLDELVTVEEAMPRFPEPRTIYQLAQFFRVPAKALLQLSGLSKPRDPSL